MMRVAMFALALLVGCACAQAEFLEQSYTSFVRHTSADLSAIAKNHGLSEQEKTEAEMFAATWIYAGPCKGRVVDHEGRSIFGSAADLLNDLGDPNRRLFSAVREMIAIMTLENLGRGPSPNTCRFAYELAKPYSKFVPESPPAPPR